MKWKTKKVLFVVVVLILIGYLGIQSDLKNMVATWGQGSNLNSLDMRSIINLPLWVRKKDKKFDLKAEDSLVNVRVNSRGLDKEELTVWNSFFYGMSGGLMLELGAMNGQDYSVSHFFESAARWRAILIEGNPNLANQLAINRPHALNFNLVICDQPQQVHFVSQGNLKGVDGVLEFMSPGFVHLVYPELLTQNGQIDWDKVKEDGRVSQVQCLPLANVLLPFGINHVNFFLLDVEGAELTILKSIDFNSISFDVIAVETDRGTDADKPAEIQAYVDSVAKFLISKGYQIYRRKIGRNSWFVHPNFKPVKKPRKKRNKIKSY